MRRSCSLVAPFSSRLGHPAEIRVRSRSVLSDKHRCHRAGGSLDESKTPWPPMDAVIAGRVTMRRWMTLAWRYSGNTLLRRFVRRTAWRKKTAVSSRASSSRNSERTTGRHSSARRYRFQQLAQIGQWADAQAIWDLLDPMGRDWSRSSYRPGDAEIQLRSVPLLARRSERRPSRSCRTTGPEGQEPHHRPAPP